MKTQNEIRPLPIRHIENTLLRRICIVVFFIPIYLIGSFIQLVRLVTFFIYDRLRAVKYLFNSGVRFWNVYEPREVKKP